MSNLFGFCNLLQNIGFLSSFVCSFLIVSGFENEKFAIVQFFLINIKLAISQLIDILIVWVFDEWPILSDKLSSF